MGADFAQQCASLSASHPTTQIPLPHTCNPLSAHPQAGPLTNHSTAQALAGNISKVIRSGALRVSAAGAGVRFRTARWDPGYPLVDTVVEDAVSRSYTTRLACVLGAGCWCWVRV